MTEYHQLDLTDLHAKLDAGAISASELTQHMLARIEALNPNINALSDVIAERALADAAHVDTERRRGTEMGPLAGVPVVTKDNMDTVPAACPAGLPFRRTYHPQADAVAVARLRAAGAIVLGVSHSDPGTFGVRTDAVTHPKAPELTVGGSSGGSAAALAAHMAFAALGSDTGGSIRIPSACCLTAGLKPTYGRISKEGVLPLAPSLDHVGPMARTVRDLAIVAAALDDAPAGDLPDTRETPVIGTDATYYADADESVKQAVEVAIAACRDLGWSVCEVALPRPGDVLGAHMLLLGRESAAFYEQAGYTDHHDLPLLARELFAAVREHGEAGYTDALRRRGEFRATVDRTFDEVDYLLLPTLAVPTPRRTDRTIVIAGETHEFTAALVRYTCLFDHTGHPALALPATKDAPGRGRGIQLVGRYNSDAALIAAAVRLEAQLNLSPA